MRSSRLPRNRIPAERRSRRHAFSTAALAAPPLAERGIVVQRDIRQRLAVQVQAGRFQAVQELAIGNADFPARRVDADDPQRAELALLVLAADVGEFQPALHGLLRRAIEFALGEKITGSPFERLFPGVPPVGSSFDSRHVSSPFVARQWRIGHVPRAPSAQMRRP